MRLLAIFAACAALCAAGERPEDVKGWTTTTWGMSEEDILKALPGQAIRLAKPEKYATFTVTIGIERLTINHVDYYAHFQPDPEGKLNRVLLRTIAQMPYENAFQDLAALLTEKYGPADFKDSTTPPIKKRTMRWTFPTTTIELTFSDLSIIKTNMLVLMYSRAGKKDPI